MFLARTASWSIEFAAGVAEHSIEHPGCSVAVVYAKTLWCCCNMQHTQTHPIAFDPSWLSWLPGALNLHDLGHVNIPAGGEIEYCHANKITLYYLIELRWGRALVG